MLNLTLHHYRSHGYQKIIIKEYCEQTYAPRLDEMDQFLERYNLTQLTLEEIDGINTY